MLYVKTKLCITDSRARRGEEPYEVTMSVDSEFYMYKQDSRRIIFRMKSKTLNEHDVMGVLVLAAGGMAYRPLEELEAMTASGAAELIGENCQYKYFREVVKMRREKFKNFWRGKVKF